MKCWQCGTEANSYVCDSILNVPAKVDCLGEGMDIMGCFDVDAGDEPTTFVTVAIMRTNALLTSVSVIEGQDMNLKGCFNEIVDKKALPNNIDLNRAQAKDLEVYGCGTMQPNVRMCYQNLLFHDD